MLCQDTIANNDCAVAQVCAEVSIFAKKVGYDPQRVVRVTLALTMATTNMFQGFLPQFHTLFFLCQSPHITYKDTRAHITLQAFVPVSSKFNMNIFQPDKNYLGWWQVCYYIMTSRQTTKNEPSTGWHHRIFTCMCCKWLLLSFAIIQGDTAIGVINNMCTQQPLIDLTCFPVLQQRKVSSWICCWSCLCCSQWNL